MLLTLPFRVRILVGAHMLARFTGCGRHADNVFKVGSIPAASTEMIALSGLLDEKHQPWGASPRQSSHMQV